MHSNNKRIAKNTLMLYIRMLLAVGINFYTSRVILNTLGAEDYGIYSIVGGIVIAFTFLNASFNGATSRFLTIELAQEKNNFGKVFSATLTLHIFIALLVLVLSETIGLWFLENKLIIPMERMSSARIVYHLSVLSVLVSITQVPYNATIISHEKMDVYAYVSIVELLLKLSAVFLLQMWDFDKLVLYAILIFVINILVACIYRIYCVKRFKGCNYKFELNSKLMLPIISFSLWDLYGNFSIVVRTQGVNFVQNIFFGPLINAATAIATQVQNVLSGFADNFLLAVRPQIVKKYALGEIREMQILFYNSSKFSFVLLFFLSAPLIIECDFILRLWLINVPDYTAYFCRLGLVASLATVLSKPSVFSIHATGKIKLMSFLNGTLFISALPLSYYFLKKGAEPTVPFIINLVTSILVGIIDFVLLKRLIKSFSLKEYFTKVILLCVFVSIMALPIPFLIHKMYQEGWVRLILVSLSSSSIIAIVTFFFVLSSEMKEALMKKIRAKFNQLINR